MSQVAELFERLLETFPGSEVVWPAATCLVPERPRSRVADGELALTADGWRCPGCGRSSVMFYGVAPNRRCRACWKISGAL
jgi:hypothetical protein